MYRKYITLCIEITYDIMYKKYTIEITYNIIHKKYTYNII